MDDNDILIDKVEPISSFGQKQENYNRKKGKSKVVLSKQSNYKDLFSKHFKKDFSNFEIDLILKDNKKIFRIYSKKTKKELFQDYSVMSDLLNFYKNGNSFKGVNLDTNI